MNRSNSSGSTISPYVVNNNAGLGNLNATYKVPNFSRNSYLIPGVGPVTTSYNPNYPIYNSPYGPYSPYVPYAPSMSPYGPYSPNPYTPSYNPFYNPYLAQYPASPYFYPGPSPLSGPYGYGLGNQFNPYGLFPAGNSFGLGAGGFDTFGGGVNGQGLGYGPRF